MARRTLRTALAALLLAVCCGALHAQVVNSEWNVGNGAWNVTTNWFPNDVPDNGGGVTYNVQIGNRPVAANATVTFVPEDASSDTVESLIMSAGADFLTNGNQLLVNGQATVTGLGTTIRVDEHSDSGTRALQAGDLDVTLGGALQLNGGIATVLADMDITSTGFLTGFGTLNVGDSDAVVEKAFQNSGLIQLNGTNTILGTLRIHANGVDTIDLDGDSDVGDVDVANAVADVEADTLTLIVDGPLSDSLGGAAGGTLQIGQRDTVTFNQTIAFAPGFAVTMDGGAHVATLNGPGVITSVADTLFTIAGNAVIENDMTFLGSLNDVILTGGSSLTLNGAVFIPQADALTMGANSTLVVSDHTTISDAANDLDWDGGGTATTTIQGTGLLEIAVSNINLANDTYAGTLNLRDEGDLIVSVGDGSWQMSGTLNKTGAGTSSIAGSSAVLTGDVNINAGTLAINTASTIGAAADLVVADGATAAFSGTIVQAGANLTVNGTLSLGAASNLAGPATFTGTGLFRLTSTSQVSANTTINVESFDWDGLGAGTTHTITNGVVFTINSTTWDDDDPSPGIDDTINLGGDSQIIVNNVASWTMARTLNANTAGVGTAVIGGSSPVIFAGGLAVLNVDGNTNVTAPITFGAGSLASVDAGMTLNLGVNASYEGGTVSGAGRFLPASANLVTASSTISATNFNFDGGSWIVTNNALLNINVSDYDTDAATNAFDGIINLNDGDISVLTDDPEFVMDGFLNMNATVNGNPVFWIGESFDLGNDAGVHDADLNVTGTEQSQFGVEVDFNSDADVNVAAGATLSLLGTVNFSTVNAANNAEFTGAGRMVFNGLVNVNEAATLNMVGGTVDLDGLDDTGEFINIDAPLTINVQTMEAFGRSNGGGGVNTLDVNNSVGTGVLTVNLDNAAAEWTLNPQGVMNLVNDNAPSTLLAGSAVNLNGTVNVTGDVQLDARVDIGGTINIDTAAEPLRLSGGGVSTNVNTIAGGVINGPGLLNAAGGHSLHGFGTILTNVDFDGTANLLANDGMLTVLGSIVDANVIGTADSDGILVVIGAWNSSVVDSVDLNGGELRGGAVTVGNASGIQGAGRVTSRVMNNTRLVAEGGTLVFETALNDNDWDGPGTGQLRADAGATLELRDVGAAFGFAGTVAAVNGGRVLSKGFALDFNPGSTLNLTAATYESTSSTDLGGTVTVNAGADSTIKVENNFFLTFETGSTTTLNGNMQLLNNNIIVEQGAVFSGPGALIVPDGSHVVGENLANIGVLLDMQGAFRPGNNEGIGRVNLFDYQQGGTGKLYVELTGTALNAFDRLVATGDVVLDGLLSIDIDGAFVPALGNTFNVISGNSVTGTFDTVDVQGAPAGLAFHVTYLANAVQLQVVNKPIFAADFDDDGDVDSTDLSIWRAAYNLNQLGDADGDNDTDGNDLLIWQRQVGSKPAVAVAGAVPEPATLWQILAVLAGTARPKRSRRPHPSTRSVGRGLA